MKSTTETIKQRLNTAFNPAGLEIIDEGHLHVGHNAPGGHFAIVISTASFNGKSQLECHRMIYAALGNLIGNEIHALRIKID